MTDLIHPETGRRIDIVYSLLGLPRNIPEIVENVHDFGQFEDMEVGVSIADQQAAAVGLGVLRPGEMRAYMKLAVSSKRLLMAWYSGRGLLPIVILALDRWKVYGVEGFI